MARRDADEFAAFVAASQPALRRTAYLMFGDWYLASDYVQDALMRVYRRWPKLQRDNSLHGYAKRAVVSVVIDAKRKRSSSEVTVERVTDGAGHSDHADLLADRDLLMSCLAELPARQRACVVLRHYDDLSVSEVASVLGCTEGTVKSQTARGLDALQSIFAQRDEELVVSGKGN